jgi:hypothetical protein
LNNQGFDVSICSKHVRDLHVGIFKRDVLHINIVYESSQGSSVFWLKFDGNSIVISITLLNSHWSRFFLIKADEAIAS